MNRAARKAAAMPVVFNTPSKVSRDIVCHVNGRIYKTKGFVVDVCFNGCVCNTKDCVVGARSDDQSEFNGKMTLVFKLTDGVRIE